MPLDENGATPPGTNGCGEHHGEPLNCTQIRQLAGCVVVDQHDRLLLLHRNTARRTQWEIPGGKVNPGERKDAAAVREMREETGAIARPLRRLGTGAFTEDGHELRYTWYLAEIVSGEPGICEPDVHDRLGWLPQPRLAQLATEGELSASTQLLLTSLESGALAAPIFREQRA